MDGRLGLGGGMGDDGVGGPDLLDFDFDFALVIEGEFGTEGELRALFETTSTLKETRVG